jgi:hypothetical protein
MAPTPQQPEAEDRRAKEDERKQREIEWRQTLRAEDLEHRAREAALRKASREEDLAYRRRETDWRVQIRTEETNWRETQLGFQSDEARRANRRYALLAATQSMKSGSDIKDILKLAANLAAWIESPDKTVIK